jgi:hypothetical protein
MTAQVPLATAALCAAFSGFTALGLAMDRHWEDAFGRGASTGSLRNWLRVGGAAGLWLSLMASLQLKDSAQGWVVWFGVMTIAAIGVVLVLSYAPARAKAAGSVATAGVALAGLAALLM